MENVNKPLIELYVAPKPLEYNLEDNIVDPKLPTTDTYSAADQFFTAAFMGGGSSWVGLSSIIDDMDEVQDKKYERFKDPQLDALSLEEIERFSGNIARAKNPEHMSKILDQINDIKRMDNIWEVDSGVVNTAASTLGMIAGLASDPTNVFTMAAGYNKAIKGLSFLSNYSRTQHALALGGMGAAGAVARQQLNEGVAGYSDTQFYMDLTFSTVLGGVMGNIMGKKVATLKEAEEILMKIDGKSEKATPITAEQPTAVNQVKSIQNVMQNTRAEIPQVIKQEDRLAENISFKLSDTANLEFKKSDNTMFGALFGGSLSVLKMFSPIYKAGTAASQMARKIGYHLVGYGLDTNAADLGLQAIPVEKMIQSGIASKMLMHDTLYTSLVAEAGKAGVSKKVLDELIENSLRTDTKSTSQFVNKYLDHHNKLYDEMLEEANKMGLFGKHADGSFVQVSKKGNYYYHIKHDFDKIAANPLRARKVYANALRNAALGERKTLDDMVKEGKELSDNLKSDKQMLDDLLESLDNPQAVGKGDRFDKLADEFIAAHTGEASNIIKSTMFKPSQLKEITLKVNRGDIAEFLDDRSFHDMFRMYAHDHVNAVEFTARFGDANMDEVFNKLNKEYEDLISKAEASGKSTKKLIKEQKQIGEALRGMKFRIQGKRLDGTRGYGATDLIIDAVTTMTAQKLMWAGALSQIPDLATLLVEMSSGKMGKMSSDFVRIHGAALKALDKETAQMIGLVSENMDTRALGMFESGTEGFTFNKLGAQMAKGREWVYKLNMMQAVNNITKAWAGEVTSKKIIDSAYILTKYAKEHNIVGDLPDDITKLTDKTLQQHVREMRRFGMDLSDAKRIVAEFESKGKTVDGVKLANMTQWEHGIRAKVYGAVKNIVDNQYIIEPNAGNKPFWFDHPLGRLVSQFKGFWLKSFETYLARDLQAANLEALVKFSFRTMLGTLAYVARQGIRMPIDQIDTDPKRLVYEGLIRGGSLGFIDGLSAGLDTVGSLTNTPIGAASWLGLRKERRYGQDNQVADLLFGASGVFIKDINSLVGSVGTGKFQEQMLKQGAAYTPIINTFYGKPILEFAVGKRNEL